MQPDIVVEEPRVARIFFNQAWLIHDQRLGNPDYVCAHL